MVLALSLISTLVAVAVSWTNTALRIQRDHEQTMRILRSVELLERAIRIDLLQLDASAESDRPRIEISSQTLLINTRDQGPRRVSYAFDAASQSVIRSIRSGETDFVSNAESLYFELELEPSSGIAVLRVSVTVEGAQHHFINHVPSRWTQ